MRQLFGILCLSTVACLQAEEKLPAAGALVPAPVPVAAPALVAPPRAAPPAIVVPVAALPAAAPAAKAPAVFSLKVTETGEPIVLSGTDTLATGASFKPPVEITLVAKTDSTNIRLGYAANQIIFNWELNQKQLRVDGGPANGKHKMGAGEIPAGKFVTIKWTVTPKKQTVSVDGQVRFEHEGDYSKIDKPVSVFTHKAKISIKSLEVKPGAGE